MQHFNNYTIIKQIGEGGMATVYLASHNSLKHQVAIKVLNKEFVFNTNIRSRFIEEARKMVRMNHPNVVKVSDLIDEENSVAIVMEYVEGLTLKDILEQKKLNDTEIESFLKQMLNAVGYVHSQGLIHRDIKPSNLILSKNGNLKLTDFGISKALETGTSEHTQTSTAMSLGTPMYMSPEQVRSTKEVTHLTDIYSLGVVLWEMVSRIKPYNANTLSSFDLQLKIVQEDLPLTKTFWDKAIQKATQKDDFKRFQSAEEFLLAIENKEVIENDFERTIIPQKVILPKQKIIDIDKNQEEKVKKKRVLAFTSIVILLIIGLVLIFNNLENSKLDDKKQNQVNALKEKKDKKIEKNEQQNTLDSLKLISKQKTQVSLKLLPEKKIPLIVSIDNDKGKIKLTRTLKIGDYLEGGYIFVIYNHSYEPRAWVIAPYEQGIYSQKDAKEVCANLSLNGFSDWQLPSISSLFLEIKPNIHMFPSFKKGLYWSYNNLGGEGSAMNFEEKEYYIIDESRLNNVRAIREVYLDPKFDYIVK